MTVRLADDQTIRLEGVCSIDDAEPLLRLVSGHPGATVDWRACEKAHTAIIQILMLAAPDLAGPPPDAYLRDRVEPLIRGRLRGKRPSAA